MNVKFGGLFAGVLILAFCFTAFSVWAGSRAVVGVGEAHRQDRQSVNRSAITRDVFPPRAK